MLNVSLNLYGIKSVLDNSWLIMSAKKGDGVQTPPPPPLSANAMSAFPPPLLPLCQPISTFYQRPSFFPRGKGWVNVLINDKGVCRTAVATPGLLTKCISFALRYRRQDSCLTTFFCVIDSESLKPASTVNTAWGKFLDHWGKF